MRVLLGVLAMWACAATAIAQQPTEPTAPTPEQVRAFADRQLNEANAREFFTVETPPAGVTNSAVVRHNRSGLRCLLSLSATGSGSGITVFSMESLGIRRGDSVSCSQSSSIGTVTLYATRRAEVMTLDAAMSGSQGALLYANPNARPVNAPEAPRPPPAADAKTLPEYRTAAYMIDTPRGPAFTRLSVAIVDGWEIKLRFTGTDASANALVDATWRAALQDLLDHPAMRTPQPPAVPTPPATTL